MEEEKKSRVSLVVDIVSPERAWTMFAAAALAPTQSAEEAAFIADKLMEEFLVRFRGGEGSGEDDESDDAEGDAVAPAATAGKASSGKGPVAKAPAAKPKAPASTAPIMGDDDDDFPRGHMPPLPAANAKVR